jgi:hypothetical protein
MKNAKNKLAILLIVLACFCWILTAIIPFTRLDTLLKAKLLTGIIILGEVFFFSALFYGGKPYWEKIKGWFQSTWNSLKK